MLSTHEHLPDHTCFGGHVCVSNILEWSMFKCLNDLRVRTYDLGNLLFFINISSKGTGSVVTKLIIEPPGVK